jgi:protein phosphatase
MTSSNAPAVVHFAALSDPGKNRTHNEDSVLCAPQLAVWAVADGMGGHQRGEVASALALQILREQIEQGGSLSGAIAAAHAAIIDAGESDSASRGMGTTLIAAQLSGCQFTLAWVGDSRAYRISAERIEQLSTDHSWVQSMVDAGEMTAEDARHHPRRNVITQCLGQADYEPEPDLVQGELKPGEILLLCSDGLTGELTDQQILQQSCAADTLDGLVSQLIKAANQNGGRDNISCIVLACEAIQPVAGPAKRGLLDYFFPSRKHAKRHDR